MPEEASCCRGGAGAARGSAGLLRRKASGVGTPFPGCGERSCGSGCGMGGPRALAAFGVAPRGTRQPQRGSPMPDSCDPTALLTREMKHKWWRCGCGEVGMEPCVYVLNYFTLIYFILMICDLSGKEERLCEHRTKK